VRTRETKADLSELYMEAMAALGVPRLFAQSALAEAGWVDARRVRELYRRAVGAGPAGGYAGLVYPLWMILSVEHWFRAIILGERPSVRGSVGELESGAVTVGRAEWSHDEASRQRSSATSGR